MYSILTQVVSSTWTIQPYLLDLFPASRMLITLGRTISAVAEINCNPSTKKRTDILPVYASDNNPRKFSFVVLLVSKTLSSESLIKLSYSNPIKPRFYVKLDEHGRKVLD